MSITKITTPELLDFPKDSTSSANTSGTVIPTGYTGVCTFPGTVTNTALYQFEDNVNDTCGGYNGTEIGSPTYVTGKFGKAISLDGSTQAITLPSILPTNSTASSSSTCWFKTTYAGVNMGTIFSAYDAYGGGTSSTPGFGLWTEGNQNFLRMASYYLFGSVVGTDGTANVSDGNWHFVAVVFDYSAGTLNCYLDGNSTPEISITGTSAASVDIWTANASIGYQKNPGAVSPRYFNGEIDQVRIFPSALSQTQITELYNESFPQVYRPTTSLNAGEFRYNQQLGYVEYYDGSTWLQIADEYISGQPTSCICNYPTRAVALYQFEDNTNDTCGNYDGTPNATAPLLTYATGKYGKAAVFNRVSISSGSYVTVPGNLPFAGDFSISIWFNPAALVPASYASGLLLMQRGYSSTIGGTGIAFYLYGTALRPWISTSGLSYQLFSAGTVAIDTWYHTVLTRTYNSQWELFLNGTSLGTYNTQGTTADFSTDHTLYFGANGLDSYYFFDGMLDQVRLFSSALNSSQVTELYNEVVCN